MFCQHSTCTHTQIDLIVSVFVCVWFECMIFYWQIILTLKANKSSQQQQQQVPQWTHLFTDCDVAAGWVTSLHVCVCVCVCFPLSLTLHCLAFCLFWLPFAEKSTTKRNDDINVCCLRFSHTHTRHIQTHSDTHTLNFNVDNCEKCAAKEIARTSSWRQLWAEGEERMTHREREKERAKGERVMRWEMARWTRSKSTHTVKEEVGGEKEEDRESVFVLLYVRCAISLPCELLKNQRKSTTKIVP